MINDYITGEDITKGLRSTFDYGVRNGNKRRSGYKNEEEASLWIG